MNQTKLISTEEAREALDIKKLIPVMKQVFAEISDQKITDLQRQAIFMPNKNIFAVMAASIPSMGVCGCKTAIFPGPGITTAQSTVNLFDLESGELKAVVSAEGITVARTAASTAAATDVLANPDASILCLVGSGNQALAHARAICVIRKITEVRFMDIYEEAARNACQQFQREYPEIKVSSYTNVKEAVQDADIVCTVSKAKEPVLFGDWLKPGCHVNAVGACGPIFREIDVTVLDVSQVFVDSMQSALHMAGDLIIPMKTGEFKETDIKAEIGSVINGISEGRGTKEEITLFETCGLSGQDVAAAFEAWKYCKGDEKGF